MSDLSPAARLLFRPSARLRANRETRGLGQGAWMVCWSAGTGDRDEIWALRGDCGLGLWRAAQGMRSEVVGVLGSGFVGAKEGRGRGDGGATSEAGGVGWACWVCEAFVGGGALDILKICVAMILCYWSFSLNWCSDVRGNGRCCL